MDRVKWRGVFELERSCFIICFIDFDIWHLTNCRHPILFWSTMNCLSCAGMGVGRILEYKRFNCSMINFRMSMGVYIFWSSFCILFILAQFIWWFVFTAKEVILLWVADYVFAIRLTEGTFCVGLEIQSSKGKVVVNQFELLFLHWQVWGVRRFLMFFPHNIVVCFLRPFVLFA